MPDRITKCEPHTGVCVRRAATEFTTSPCGPRSIKSNYAIDEAKRKLSHTNKNAQRELWQLRNLCGFCFNKIFIIANK